MPSSPLCRNGGGGSALRGRDPLYLLLALPIHGLCYLVCLKDPRAFRLLWLWLQTKGKSRSRAYWTASSASPLVNTRDRNWRARC